MPPKTKAQPNNVEKANAFQKGDYVWAKIDGWPWWPAKIAEVPSKKQARYKVQYFGENSQYISLIT